MGQRLHGPFYKTDKQLLILMKELQDFITDYYNGVPELYRKGSRFSFFY